jgi:hypothetical protein
VVIDFSKLARGEVPPGSTPRASTCPRLERDDQQQHDLRRLAQCARFEDRPANSSLIGAHRIAGNYSPEIAFNLSDDFMPALRATRATSRAARSG